MKVSNDINNVENYEMRMLQVSLVKNQKFKYSNVKIIHNFCYGYFLFSEPIAILAFWGAFQMWTFQLNFQT